MQLTFHNNQLKIDNGDHYFIGLTNKQDFPTIISENYEDIITKSFDNFSDENTTISHIINDNQYIINFKYNCKPLNISEEIRIDLVKHIKDFKDYMNERIERLENENVLIKKNLSELANIVLKNNTEEAEEEAEEEVVDETEDEEESEVPIVQTTVKGKATVSTKSVSTSKNNIKSKITKS